MGVYSPESELDLTKLPPKKTGPSIKRPVFKYDKELKLVVMDRKVLRACLPQLKELSKTSKTWYWLYQCAKHDNLRKMRKANKAFWRAWAKEKKVRKETGNVSS